MEVVNIIIVFSLCIERVKLNDRVYSIKKYSSNTFVVDKRNGSRVFYLCISRYAKLTSYYWQSGTSHQKINVTTLNVALKLLD